MKIGTALAGLKSLYPETAPLIYDVETSPTYIARMDAIVDVIEKQPIQAFSSVISLAEVLNHPMKGGNKSLEKEYRDILINSGGYQLVPITVPAADLRTPDALHIASAIHVGCDAFLTNDTGIKRVTELTILILDELEL